MREVCDQYESVFKNRIGSPRINSVVNGLEAAGLVTFRREYDGKGGFEKYVRISEKSKSVKF